MLRGIAASFHYPSLAGRRDVKVLLSNKRVRLVQLLGPQAVMHAAEATKSAPKHLKHYSKHWCTDKEVTARMYLLDGPLFHFFDFTERMPYQFSPARQMLRNGLNMDVGVSAFLPGGMLHGNLMAAEWPAMVRHMALTVVADLHQVYTQRDSHRLTNAYGMYLAGAPYEHPFTLAYMGSPLNALLLQAPKLDDAKVEFNVLLETLKNGSPAESEQALATCTAVVGREVRELSRHIAHHALPLAPHITSVNRHVQLLTLAEMLAPDNEALTQLNVGTFILPLFAHTEASAVQLRYLQLALNILRPAPAQPAMREGAESMLVAPTTFRDLDVLNHLHTLAANLATRHDSEVAAAYLERHARDFSDVGAALKARREAYRTNLPVPVTLKPDH